MVDAVDKKYKILVVEDDVFMIELLSKELAVSGFDVVIAKNGTEGIKKFEESKPDLLVLDLLLPDMNGFDTLRKVRRSEEGRNVKVIILSNLSETSDIEEGRRLGVNDYLIKANYSLKEIVDRIRAILKG